MFFHFKALFSILKWGNLVSRNCIKLNFHYFGTCYVFP